MIAPPLSSQRFSVRSIWGPVITLTVFLIILLALWLAATSVVENMHFARATDQILGIVGATRDYTTHDKSFAMQPGEDLLASLGRAGIITNIDKDGSPSGLTNPWEGSVQATVLSPYAIRLETKVPVRDCRRLALSFARDAVGLGILAIEAHEDGSSLWRRFLDSGQNILPEDSRPIEAACGDAPQTALALVFRLR